MRATEVISSTPIETEKTVRGDEIRTLTSCRAGKIVPISYIPLLREDRVSRGRVRVRFEMAETVKSLMNAVNVTVYAHLVPFSAFGRFVGMDTFNRSYQGIGEPHNNTPVNFFQMMDYGDNPPFWKTMGIHWPSGKKINSAPLEAYNVLVNWRRSARSTKLPQREWLQGDLAQAFWKNPNMWHIVPDYDQAMLDGEVPIEFASSTARVAGIGVNEQYNTHTIRVKETGGHVRDYGQSYASDNVNQTVYVRASESGAPMVFAELEDSGVTLSLANIELAKKTAAFAKLRSQYSGLDDDHLIDLLMEGIRVPEEALKQPILLDRKSTIFGYSERHAMDGASLDKSVTTGRTEVDLVFRTPPINTGGIILITAEIVPEQLFERMEDVFLSTSDPATLPNFLRDYLDPEKVDVVPNRFVDVHHGTPDATFGYAPLNHHWKRSLSRIGGRYFRPAASGFVEDRQRFWSVEQLNPTLTKDFYMVPDDLPHTVFMDQRADPFEVLALGNVEIVGNTVFGKVLEEDRGDYEAVFDEVDTTRIKQK